MTLALKTSVGARTGRAGLRVTGERLPKEEAIGFTAALPKSGIAGVSESDTKHPSESSNPIVRWLLSKGVSLGSLLAQLTTADHDFAQAARTASIAQVRRRLALALFTQYCSEQRLLTREVAMLLGDAQRAASEALNFLISGAASEGNHLQLQSVESK